MQKYFTVFDMDNNKIGFAKANLFKNEGKSIEINDSLIILELLLGSIIVAIFLIWLIKKLSNLS